MGEKLMDQAEEAGVGGRILSGGFSNRASSMSMTLSICLSRILQMRRLGTHG